MTLPYRFVTYRLRDETELTREASRKAGLPPVPGKKWPAHGQRCIVLMEGPYDVWK